MEKYFYFLSEKERDRKAAYLKARGYCVHTFRHVSGFMLVYAVKYWK